MLLINKRKNNTHRGNLDLLNSPSEQLSCGSEGRVFYAHPGNELTNPV